MTEKAEKTVALTCKVAKLTAMLLLPAAVQANGFQDPSRYFSYQRQDTADAAWISTDQYRMCSPSSLDGRPASPAYAARIVALSGSNRVIKCDSADMEETKARITAAAKELNAAEIASAAAARSAMDGDIPNFTTDAMLMNLLKYASNPLSEQAWLATTRDEITRAQYADKYGATSGKKTMANWIFPPESLRDRNPDIAAQELLPRFKTEALKRAKDVHGTFVMRSMIGNVKYDLASGVILFGNGKTADGPIIFKQPMNANYNGSPIYALSGSSDGISRYTDDTPLTVAGFRSIVAAGRQPGLVTDRELLAHAIKMPQDRAEKLLNKTNMLIVNVVMTITGADRLTNQNGLSLGASNGVLFARVDRMFVTDLTGMPLATYAVDALPLRRPPKAAPAKSARR